MERLKKMVEGEEKFNQDGNLLFYGLAMFKVMDNKNHLCAIANVKLGKLSG
jgi:hypothetical protein